MDKILTYEEAEAVFSSPALAALSSAYPKKYQGRVPLFVKMNKTVVSDLPLEVIALLDKEVPVAIAENEYPVWVNSHGAVAIIYPDGNKFGVKPSEFTVTKFHPSKK